MPLHLTPLSGAFFMPTGIVGSVRSAVMRGSDEPGLQYDPSASPCGQWQHRCIVYHHEGFRLGDTHRGMTRNVFLPGIVFLKELDISRRGNTLALNYSGTDSAEEHDHD